MMLVALLGMASMTWLFPLVSVLFSSTRRRPRPRICEVTGQGIDIEVLIPAHNEENSIEATLRSIRRAVDFANERGHSVRCRVRVGCDSCSDRTMDRARSLGAEVLELNHRSKWRSLRSLISAGTSEWVFLVDSGIVWPKHFFVHLATDLATPDVVGLAPRYSISRASRVAKLHWALEAHLKNIENLSGGPVTVHGATVGYRRMELLAALRRLESITSEDWLNDDVVIPLAVRFQNPKKKIRYCSDVVVSDGDEDALAVESGRRKRLAAGNIQWMRTLLPQAFRPNRIVFLLALRRVSRLFWGYWIGALVLMVAAWSPILFAFVFLFGFHPVTRRLFHAFRWSLLSPLLIFQSRKSAVVWK